MKKKKLSARKWLLMFLVTAVLLSLTIPALNYAVDPYGAFGDRFFHWWSYDETLNPRMAKISYLERNFSKYDSYIIGSSGSSSYPVELLNEYLDARFYNCFFYGTDMRAYEQIADYLIENYTVKNLVLNLSPRIASKSPAEEHDLTDRQYYKVDGSSPAGFALQYLFIKPVDSVQKIRLRLNDGYLQMPYRVFDEETGAYDKSRRDSEPIGELDEYLEREEYQVFKKYPRETVGIDPDILSMSMDAVARIRDLCEERGIRLIVLCQPGYWEFVDSFPEGDIAIFRNALAEVTDYWDFTLSSVSYEPRYFYDATHFRNCVGEMALARIFGGEAVYIPEDFGEFVRRGSSPGAPEPVKAGEEEYTVRIPVLIYHDLGDGQNALPEALFEEQMEALCREGYEAVDFYELRAWTEEGADLPEKPVVITFDDGYESVYTIAYPILERLGLKASVFAIGVSVGKDTYKDTGEPMTAHFDTAEAREMDGSGVVAVFSHGYDIHEVEGRDENPIRKGILQREDEPEDEYVAFLKEDCAKMRELLGKEDMVLAYPYGLNSELAEVVLREEGIFATLTTEEHWNTLIRGVPQSLRGLGRINTDGLSGEDLISKIEEMK